MEAWLMKWAWYKLKSGWWRFLLGIIVGASTLIYLYRLLRPTEDKLKYLEALRTEATTALKESELRGRLQKDKIGAIKGVFEGRLRDTKKIEDREERLRALIRLHQDLDI